MDASVGVGVAAPGGDAVAVHGTGVEVMRRLCRGSFLWCRRAVCSLRSCASVSMSCCAVGGVEDEERRGSRGR